MAVRQRAKYAVALGLIGAALLWSAWQAEPIFIRILLAWGGAAFVGVALAYAGAGPGIFRKKQSGSLGSGSSVFFFPYFLFNKLSLWLYRHSGSHTAFTRITENVYLGCQPAATDVKTLRNLGIQSVLDLTCEFSEPPQLRNLNYLCVPTLDTDVPSLEQLTQAACWIEQHSQTAPVYVHCALGHGRSAMFVAAYLMVSGQCASAGEAIDKIRQLRPKIGLHPEQISLLQELETKFGKGSGVL